MYAVQAKPARQTVQYARDAAARAGGYSMILATYHAHCGTVASVDPQPHVHAHSVASVFLFAQSPGAADLSGRC